MLENEAKGWYGSYSLAGRRSAEKFNNILHKNEILKGDNKRIKIPDMFAPDEMKPNHANDKLDIYQIYSLDSASLKKKIKQKYDDEEKQSKDKPIKKFSLFFHNRHCSLENKRVGLTTYEPGCTRYSPNYNYIWPKLITGIKWDAQMGRKKKKVQIDNRDFIINNLENYDKYVINSGFVKCFVNMNNKKKKKLLLKKNIIINNSINNRNKLNNFNTKGTSKTSNNFYNINKSYDVTNVNKATNLADKKNKGDNNFIDEYISQNLKLNNYGNTDINFFTKSKLLKNNKNKKNLYLESTQDEENTSKINLLKSSGPVPNFSKIPSREKKFKSYHIENIPFVFPKYSFVQERSLTMAVYKKEKPVKNYKPKPFKGMILGLDYDPDKVFEKYNNHQSPKVPKFKNMTSRPNKKGSPLPSFLQKVYDRSASYLTTDKSLKLNNFAEGKYIPADNSFFPKKSYNKIINVKITDSKLFKEKSPDEDIQNKKNQVVQKLKLDGADYEELKTEGALNKFDNFCYKSILRKKPKEDIKNLLITFECEENGNK